MVDPATATASTGLGLNSIYLLVIVIVVGWIYLLLTNTAMALRIVGGVGTVLFTVTKALTMGLFNIFSTIFGWIFGKKR